MQGPMEWAVFIFMGALVLGSMGIAWRTRGLIATRDIANAAALTLRDLAIADLTKDVRHLKGNLAQHANNYADMHDEQIRLGAEVQRLGKIVNGKH